MILRHPAFEHIIREVSSKDAKAWRDAGWLPVGGPMIAPQPEQSEQSVED